MLGPPKKLEESLADLEKVDAIERSTFIDRLGSAMNEGTSKTEEQEGSSESSAKMIKEFLDFSVTELCGERSKGPLFVDPANGRPGATDEQMAMLVAVSEALLSRENGDGET